MHSFQKSASVGDYTPLHVAATGTAVAVGQCYHTTSTDTITASASAQSMLVGSAAGISVGDWVNIYDGSNGEDVQITAVNTGTNHISAVFTKNHSGTTHVTSKKEVFLGAVIINKVGTTDTITLYNGHPNAQTSSVIAIITPATTRGDYQYQVRCLWGLFYTVAGTAGDYTITYQDSGV